MPDCGADMSRKIIGTAENGDFLLEPRPAPPRPSEPNNRDRANWAQEAVHAFHEATGSDKDNVIADLVADLCHLAKRYKQDPFEQVRRGLAMYCDERDYAPDGWAPFDNFVTVTIEATRPQPVKRRAK